MLQKTGIDSVVLQVQGNTLRTAERVAKLMGAVLQVMKSLPVRPTKEDKRLWYQVYRRPLPTSAVFVALLHTHRGVSIPILRYGNSKGLQLEFHGLRALQQDSYAPSDTAIQQQATLEEFMAVWKEPVRMMRFDRSIDLIGQKWKGFTNSRTHRTLCKKHGASTFEDTTLYYQPKKPTYTKVLAYDKREKNALAYDVTRIEFSFVRRFWHSSKDDETTTLIEMATRKADTFINRRLSVKCM